MKLQKLRLVNWRNYRDTELVFDDGVTVICGENAQGKTNLLEAVSYLGIASSFRGAADADLINRDADYFFLGAELESAARGRFALSAAQDRRHKRKWQVDGEPRRRLADIIGLCHSVVFSPDDIYLVKGGPERRRRWLNRQLAQSDAVYCRDMLAYNRVLRQRNAILRGWAKEPQPEALAAWDEQLAEYGSRVTLARYLAAQRLAPLAAELHASLSGGEELALSYKSQLIPKDGSAAGIEEISGLYRSELARHALAEQVRGVTLVGPHRDEVRLFLDGAAARDFASQGQQRTLAVSLKLAELELAREVKGEYPLLLLDDVLSELDDARRARILSLQAKAQTFITAAGRHFPTPYGKRLLVEAVGGIADIREL